MSTVAKSISRRRGSRNSVRTSVARPAQVHRTGPSAYVQDIQRSVGNLATAQWLRSHVIQAKRTVSPPGDQHEREADRVADDIMRTRDPSTPLFQRAAVNIRRFCAECEKGSATSGKEGRQPIGAETADAAETVGVSPRLESYLNSSDSAGSPLPASVRSSFEPRLGHDLRGVRIHNDSRAAQAAAEINALAFTTGANIYFASGRFQPGTAAGDRLLAHELTHVVQQGASSTLQPRIQRQFGENPFGPPLPDLPEPDFDCNINLAAGKWQDFVNCCAQTPVGRGCSDKVIEGICKIPGVNCGGDKPEPALKCPPGFKPGATKEFKRQCCPQGSLVENARDCCPESRIIVNAVSPRCCPEGTLPDADRKTCTTSPPPLPLPLCLPGQRTVKGECCFPPFVSNGLSCVMPPSPPPKPLPLPVTPTSLEIFFKKDKPGVGASAATLDANLTDQGKANFSELANQLRDNPALKVQLVGRTSPEGEPDYNMSLGQRRAEMIAATLVAREGIDSSRIADPPTSDLRPECKPIRAGIVTCGEVDATGPNDRQVLSLPFVTP
jgi:hypothetical protein